MRPWQAFAHAAAVVIAVWFCRYTLFETLQSLMGRPPSDGLILGSIVFSCAVASMPIVVYHFSHVQVSFSMHLISSLLFFQQIERCWFNVIH